MLLFSILGLCGGLLCCVGDILFDLKGAGNEKLGTSKNIDSNWMRMSEWRFGASILCAFFGDAGDVPMLQNESVTFHEALRAP